MAILGRHLIRLTMEISRLKESRKEKKNFCLELFDTSRRPTLSLLTWREGAPQITYSWKCFFSFGYIHSISTILEVFDIVKVPTGRASTVFDTIVLVLGAVFLSTGPIPFHRFDEDWGGTRLDAMAPEVFTY